MLWTQLHFPFIGLGSLHVLAKSYVLLFEEALSRREQTFSLPCSTWFGFWEWVKLLTPQYLRRYITCMDCRLKYIGIRRGSPTEKKKTTTKKMVSKWLECDLSASQQESLFLTCRLQCCLWAGWQGWNPRLGVLSLWGWIKNLVQTSSRRLGELSRFESFLMEASWKSFCCGLSSYLKVYGILPSVTTFRIGPCHNMSRWQK